MRTTHTRGRLVGDTAIDTATRLFDITRRKGPGLEEARMPEPFVEPHRDYESMGGYFFPPSFSSSNLAKGESAAASPFFSVVA